jgi:hypothetical protein
MSPSSRGLVPGLFLALVAVFGVLGANDHWLLPAQGETGVRYFVAAPVLARGEAPLTPWIPAGETGPVDALADQGRLMPVAMAVLVRQGARPHVAALWVMAGAAAVAVVAVSWVAGGVAGIPGAVVAGAVFLVGPATLEAATLLGPDMVLAALAALLLGTLTYRPRAGWLHGLVAAAAWYAGPAGLGLVATAMVWPFTRAAGARSGGGRATAAGTAALPAVVLLAAGALHSMLGVPGVHGAGVADAWAAARGIAAFLGPGLPPMVGSVVGALGLAGLVLLVVADAVGTPLPPPDVHWSDPAAPDALARIFRPAAGLVALGALLGATASGSADSLLAPWFPVTVPVAALVGATVVRWTRRGGGWGRWTPAACLAVWVVLSGWATRRTFVELRESGRAYTAAHWVASPLIRWIDNESGPYRVLHADQPALVLLQTGRPSRGIASEEGGVEALVRDFGAAPGAVVLTGAARSHADEIRRRLALEVLVDDPDGVVLGR